MALPSFNLPGKNISDQKQMSMMRSYLSQLKDETESELYDIKWDNLSQGLREKLDNLQMSVTNVEAGNDYLSGYLAANYIQADAIAATYVTTAVLEANYVTTAVLEADYITADEIAAEYVTASQVSAQIAQFNFASIGLLFADDILVSGKIMASRLSATNIASVFTSSNTALFGRVNSQKYRATNSQNTQTLDLRLISVTATNGQTAYVLGTTTTPVGDY